jgi:hypothetical protein
LATRVICLHKRRVVRRDFSTLDGSTKEIKTGAGPTTGQQSDADANSRNSSSFSAKIFFVKLLKMSKNQVEPMTCEPVTVPSGKIFCRPLFPHQPTFKNTCNT